LILTIIVSFTFILAIINFFIYQFNHINFIRS
jgi:hypothetical protein